MKKAIAIITARGGSKRIPKKNIKPFHGKPIIAYSIEEALKSCVFDEVMVSTDDEEIAAVAIQYGAVVPFKRSAKASDDYASTADVISEVLEAYKGLGQDFEYACCIYPTAPFVSAEKLKNALQLLIEKNADSLIPVTKFSFPIWRSFKMEGENISYNWPEFAPKRSQDLPPAYHDCGQFYFFKANTFLTTKKLVTENTIGLEVPETEVQDIDNEEDWKIAEIKYGFMHNIGR
ncbi:CMP-N-acetylneuraminic acid synthetase [Rufibacter radiotolerans]|uniref:CMP-N-acetylneuraminic acid synthetase n=1 Tax=Rufibacter radiotolerans TaxID=1379910 RepID=A0A0H4VLK3_9BACT|nr:pseudaminic acid cytidylyltransferase [Rufibacter radiotolerans]AKQ44787.1 CMP-N-acetylneuraminic acid synthetase [Rufibacter radiotolerans]